MHRQEDLLDIESLFRALKQEISDLATHIEDQDHKAIIAGLHEKLDQLSVVKVDHAELTSLIASNDIHAAYETILDNHKHQLIDDEQLAANLMARLASIHERIAPSVGKLASN